MIKRIVLALMFVAVIVFAFSNTFKGEFVWDDYYYILGWSQLEAPIQHVSSLLKGEMPLAQGTAYRPVRSLYTALSYQLWGRQPLGYHVQAVLIHIVVSCLAYFVLWKLGCNKVVSIIAALFFSIHPLQVQSVAWITGSLDVVAYLFFFLSLSAYLINLKKRKTYLTYGSIIFAWLAFFSKEQTFILPIILFLFEMIVVGKKKVTWKKVIFAHRYYWLGLVAYAFVRASVMPSLHPFPSIVEVNGSWLLSVVLLFWYYRLMLWPDPLTVNHNLGSGITSFYREDMARLIPIKTLINWQLAFGLVLILIVVMFAFRWRRRYPIPAFLLAASMVSFLPVIQLVPTNTIFWELYAYIPLFFFCGLIASLFEVFITRKYTWVGLLVVTLLTTSLVWKTRTQNAVWASKVSLWSNTVAITPNSAKANYNLGLAYYVSGQPLMGLPYVEKAASLKPFDKNYILGLLNVYLEQQQDEKLVGYIASLLSTSRNQQNDCRFIFEKLSHYDRADLMDRFDVCRMISVD